MKVNLIRRGSTWTVPEDTVPTNVYTSNYLSHRTVQYESSVQSSAQSNTDPCSKQKSCTDVGN